MAADGRKRVLRIAKEQRPPPAVGQRLPHSDSTWPGSQQILKKHAAHLTETGRDLVLHDNVAELYRLEVARL